MAPPLLAILPAKMALVTISWLSSKPATGASIHSRRVASEDAIREIDSIVELAPEECATSNRCRVLREGAILNSDTRVTAGVDGAPPFPPAELPVKTPLVTTQALPSNWLEVGAS